MRTISAQEITDTVARLCIEANTRCLLSCPQADPDAAFLCASQCRSRFKSCKSRAALR